MKKPNIEATVLLSLLLVSGISSISKAAEVRIPVTEVASITSDAQPGESRILIKFDVPELPKGSRIDIATVHLKLTADTDSNQVFAMQAFPVTATWNKAEVNWSSTWSKDGGDFDQNVEEVAALNMLEGDEIYFDITRIMRKWAVGEMINNGIILMRTEEKVENLSFAPVANLEGGVIAEVQILYTLPLPVAPANPDE